MEPESPPSSLHLPVGKTLAKLDENRGIRAVVNAQRGGDSRNQLIIERKGLHEERVQNAVKFLLHPSVKGSSTVHRRSFLEKKGLSKEEIEEAFYRAALSDPAMNLNGACGCTETSASKEETAVGHSQDFSGKPDPAPHSASYLKVMEMLERGETPPGIQEIDDKPPNPYQQPSVSRLQPRPKPWETIRTQSSSSPSKLRTYSSTSHTESTTKSMTRDNWRQGDDGSIMQEIYTSPVSSDAVIETGKTVPWWMPKKELESPSCPKLEVVTDSNEAGVESPSHPGTRSEGYFNGSSFHNQVTCPSWGPPPSSQMEMPDTTKDQNMEAKNEAKPLSSIHVTPDLSHLEDPPSPMVDPKCESDNVLASIQYSEGKEKGFE